MSVMSADGKIYQPGGGWWSPYGDTDEEIRENMKTEIGRASCRERVYVLV